MKIFVGGKISKMITLMQKLSSDLKGFMINFKLVGFFRMPVCVYVCEEQFYLMWVAINKSSKNVNIKQDTLSVTV